MLERLEAERRRVSVDRAARPGGGAGPRRPRPPRRGQPVPDRPAAAARGAALPRPGRARGGPRRDEVAGQPGDDRAADPGAVAAPDGARRPRPAGGPLGPGRRPRPPEQDRHPASTPPASSRACPWTFSWSPTGSPRRRSRTPRSTRTRPGSASASATTLEGSRSASPTTAGDSASTRPLSGLGLGGMRERALLVGGDLSIESRPDEGTRIRLRVPIREVDGNPAGIIEA